MVRVGFATLCLLVFALGCSKVEKNSLEGQSCTKTSDCANSLACINLVCVGTGDDGGQILDVTEDGSTATDVGPSPTDDGPSPTDDGPSPTDDGPSPTDDGPSPTDDGPIPSDGGPSDTTPPILGVCTKIEDTNLLTQGSFEYEGEPYDNLQSALFDIGFDCVVQEPGAVFGGNCDTVTDCVKEQSSLSSECSTCFGEVVCCGATDCPLECAFAADEDCIACAKEACQESFQACSGLLWDNVF